MKTIKNVLTKYILVTASVLLTAASCEKGEDTTPAPLDQNPTKSTADLVVGMYSGSATRWYAPYNSDCHTDASVFTKTGNVTINIIKVNDSTVSMQISSINSFFEPFPPVGKSYYSEIKVRQSELNKIVGSDFVMGNVAWGYPYGSHHFTYQDNSIKGLFDVSSGGCFESSLKTPNWSTLDGVNFTAVK